jgi:hypothetical protein
MGGNPTLVLEGTPSMHLQQPLLALPFVHKFRQSGVLTARALVKQERPINRCTRLGM